MKRSLACILPWGLAAFMPQAVSGAVIVIATNATITPANFELQGHDIIISNSLVSIEGTHSFSSLQVLAGAEITHGTGGIGLNVTATNDITIAAGARIRADGKGGVSVQGPGAGYSSGSPTSGSGGGHGGRGGANGALVPGGAAYGSYVAPSTPGSAGGAGAGGLGGAGGGVVRLQAGGTLRIDGAIAANGAAGMSSRSGGGSGGSIHLRAAEITGVGSVAADGGAGEPGAGGGGGGGGGGRISLQSMANKFAGRISLQGGSGFAAGGAGTLYISQPNSVAGELVLDNGGREGETPVGPLQASLDVKIRGGAVVTPQTSMHLRNLTIVSGSLRVTNQSQAIDTTGHVVVEREGRIEADRVNVGSGAGTGGMSFGVFATGGGGGHGGYGGAGTNAVPYGGAVHGSSQKPVALGGRGGGMLNTWGAGGGAIRMSIQGTLLCNGVISARGGNSADGAGGGGAGGSIWITAGTIAGTGALVANGGRGNRPGAEMGGGGGGGGRIAIQVNTNLFKGSLSARGGEGGVAGGAGTIFTALTRLPGAVLVDNGGLQGTNTAITEPTGFGLTVQNGAVVSIGQQTVSHLILRSNGWLSASSGIRPTPVKLRVTGHALIEEGSGIRVDGAGYRDASGPGRGWEVPGSLRSGGGSHGGYGGAATSPVMTRSSNVYGSIISPADPGSGGAPPRTGGAGGGSLELNVAGSLNLSGTISANGLRGTTIGAGGGAGGSININVGALVGAGSISANGADGVGLGGGGGGGRIALRYGTNVFYGQVTAHGGRGEFPGGPGTIYARSSGGPGLVLIENGNQNGPTALSELNSIFDLHVANGARVWVSNSVMNLNNLTIGPASTLHFPTLPTNVLLKVAGFAEVQEGGLLSVNGAGYPAGAGPGAGVSSNGIGSGAGHGGRGGASSLSAGGNAYGSSSHPDLRGSGGGRGAAQSSIAGSSGGGALRLQIGRGLLLDGAITANGESAQAESGGGGSGGSVWIETPMFLGSGSIEARGGDGEALQGGGGGGGRVLIDAGFDSYLGTVDVPGGRGYMAGEAGTITSSDTPPGNGEPPALQVGSVSNESVVMRWPGTLGATYRAFASTDLVVWEPSGPVITCTRANEVMQLTFPIEPGPCKFYRVASE